jgi:hypothetical protein
VADAAPDLIEACRAQIAACRELSFARRVLEMSVGTNSEPMALRRYREALDAAQTATRASDLAQSHARSLLPDDDQPELPW